MAAEAEAEPDADVASGGERASSVGAMPLSPGAAALRGGARLLSSAPGRVVRPRMPGRVRIVEVGARDGLQNEAAAVPTAAKVRLVEDLAAAGLTTVEVTGFVSPRWVPQLADAGAVLRGVRRRAGVSYPVLVPNMRGFEAAVAAGAAEVAVFAAATDAFSQKNINCSVADSLRRFEPVLAAARARGVRVRGYVSVAVGCPYQGQVPPEDAARVARALYALGCYEVSLGDTIGVGTPRDVVDLVAATVAAGVPADALAIHCHDTRGTALANVLAAMSAGVAVVDSSIAGLGGCPFAPGAAGNLATEDLVYMLQGMRVDIGDVDLPRLIEIGNDICALLGRQSSAKVAQAAKCDPKQGGQKPPAEA